MDTSQRYLRMAASKAILNDEQVRLILKGDVGEMRVDRTTEAGTPDTWLVSKGLIGRHVPPPSLFSRRPTRIR